MKIRILQAKASKGARSIVGALREEGLNALRTKVNGSAYRGHPSHLIVNWGRNEYPYGWNTACRVFNDPHFVSNATDKITCFEKLSEAGMDHHIPLWTTDIEEAKSFFDVGVEKVYCRKLTRGSQGRGIHVATSRGEVEHAPLYTAGVECAREIRVHVWSDSVIDYAQKKKLGSETRSARGIESEPSEVIRNHSNGWVFARGGVEIPERARVVAVSGVRALGLDFGAVDMILTPQDVPKILEVNTAPGVEGTTLESYKNAILGMVRV